MNILQLKPSNILFTAENEIKEICKPITDLFNLEYYSYGRFYDDGRCVLLSTNSNVFVNHFEKEYKLTISPKNENPSQNKIYNLILIDSKLPEIIADEYNIFNHGVMIDLIRKHEGYYEMFCYVANKDASDPANTFLNNLGKLESFSDYFLEQTKNSLKISNKSLIQLPESMRPLIKSRFEITDEEYSIFYRGISISLSKRQIECLALLTMGKGIKEISNTLNIANKTVDDHIRSIKNKLGCKKRSELCYVGIKNNLTDLAYSIMKKYEKKL